MGDDNQQPASGRSGERAWVDLASRAAGLNVTHEATRRRQAEGAGADRSWRVGADGEVAVGQLLAELTTPSRWDRLRGRAPGWRVLHSVPLSNADGQQRGDVDHVVIGPPGVITVNTKHHRAGLLRLEGDTLVVNGRPTDYVRRARLEGLRVAELLRPVLVDAGHGVLAGRLQVRPLLAVVGGRLVVTTWPTGVSVVMTRQLVHTLTSMPSVLSADEVAAVYELARRSTTWEARRRFSS